MKITGVETIQIAEFSGSVRVRLHVDQGLVGLGETFRNAQAAVAEDNRSRWALNSDLLSGNDLIRRTSGECAL